MPLSTLDLKKVKRALTCRTAVMNRISKGEVTLDKSTKKCLYGENVKMVENLQLRPVILTDEERKQVAVKYQSGLTMADIANFYGCHYTTIGRILRKQNIPIRDS